MQVPKLHSAAVTQAALVLFEQRKLLSVPHVPDASWVSNESRPLKPGLQHELCVTQAPEMHSAVLQEPPAPQGVLSGAVTCAWSHTPLAHPAVVHVSPSVSVQGVLSGSVTCA
jgi:hypothetical protein